MIRLIIFAIGVFLLWLLFLSSFRRQTKIILSVSAILLAALGVWFESYGDTPRHGLIQAEQIVVCGIAAEYSYRTNYNIDFCLENTSGSATVQRIELLFSAQDCTVDPCRQLDAVTKAFGIVITPGQKLRQTKNLEFDKLYRSASNISWKIDVLSVKATH